jgi:hypothetical protein
MTIGLGQTRLLFPHCPLAFHLFIDSDRGEIRVNFLWGPCQQRLSESDMGPLGGGRKAGQITVSNNVMFPLL